MVGAGVIASVVPLIPMGSFLTGKDVEIRECPNRHKIANLRDLKPNRALKLPTFVMDFRLRILA